MIVQSKNTEIHILNTATRLFKTKGYSGTSLQDIAQESGTNKSQINYYFRSKEKLFAQIFRSEFKSMFSAIGLVMMSDLPLKQKIEQIIQIDMDRILAMPELPLFIMSELHQNAAILLKELDDIPIKLFISHLEMNIQEEVKMGNIKPITPLSLMMNIQSLTIYPFIAKPMLQHRLSITNEEFNNLMQQRKNEIIDMIWNTISIK